MLTLGFWKTTALSKSLEGRSLTAWIVLAMNAFTNMYGKTRKPRVVCSSILEEKGESIENEVLLRIAGELSKTGLVFQKDLLLLKKRYG